MVLRGLILFGEASLRRAVTQFIEHYHLESNALTNAKAISYSFLLPFRHHHDMLLASNVTRASVDCSSSINAPHEYFDLRPRATWTEIQTIEYK
jgi:hypothetical protein